MRKSKSPLRVVRRKQTGTGKILSPVKARIVERRLTAFRMRRDGYAFWEIAQVLQVHEDTVAADIRAVMHSMAQETKLNVDEHREIEDAKMDEITKSFMPLTRERKITYIDPKNPKLTREKILAPDPVAAQIVMNASDRKRKLNALDKPETKHLEISAVREYKGVDLSKV